MGKRRQGWIGAILAFLLFVGLAALPFALRGQTTPPWVQASKQISPVPLTETRPSLTPVALATTAQPIEPEQPPVTAPAVDSMRMAALVAGEDLRLRTLLHHIGRLTYPVVVPGSGQLDVSSGVLSSGVSTLVLPGPANYTIADLESAGAVVPLKQGGFLLVDSVLVGSGATLTLGGSGLPTLLMESSTSGFTSLVTWGGTLTLYGEFPDSPLTIMSWNPKTNLPADDRSYGRPYIRAVGGRLDLRNVHASHLGFWSGRTGGVAWTGISSRASTGSATSSMFIANTYGAFLSRTNKVQFADDLFQENELDGLRLHRGTLNSTVVNSTAARNGSNGFVVSRGATGNVLRGDLAIHNGTNGFLINGQSLVRGAGPSGGETTASVGTILEGSDAENNAHTGILVEGGAGTIIRYNIVCGLVTGIAVRQGATDTFIVGNEVRCGGRVALSIGPQVSGTTVEGNLLSNARIGMLIRNSPGVRVMNNRITGMSVFGISVRGLSPGVVGNDNLIAGRGFQPIDTRGGAVAPVITHTDISAWQHRSSVTFVGYLRYHPLITTWLVILVLVIISSFRVRLRRRPARPYAYTVPWRPATPSMSPSISIEAPAALPVAAAGPAPVRPIAEPNISRQPERVPVAAAVTTGVLWRPFAEYAHAQAKPEMADVPATQATRQPSGAKSANGRKPKQTVANARSTTSRPERNVAAASVMVPAEPQDLTAGAAAAVSSDASHQAEKSPPNQFWKLLATGSWAVDESRVGLVADREAPA